MAGEPAGAIVFFFECLCLAGLGEAAGAGVEAVVWAMIGQAENAVNAIRRGMSFFMASGLSAAGIGSQ